MKKSQTEPTTAKNLEEKFEGGEDVLDYFDVPKARIISPESDAASTGAPAYSEKHVSGTVVRENSARYRKKK
jgi:hypothetical protein